MYIYTERQQLFDPHHPLVLTCSPVLTCAVVNGCAVGAAMHMNDYFILNRGDMFATLPTLSALSEIVVWFGVENKCIVLRNILDSLLNTCIDTDSLLIITK